MAVWAISLLPDIDPFFVKGDLLYERTLSPGRGTCSPTSATARGSPCASCCSWRAWRTMVGLAHAAQRRRRGADDGGAAARQHARSSTPATCCCARSASASRCRRAGCCGRSTRAAIAARARAATLLRAPYGMRFLQLSSRSATSSRRGASRVATPGTTAPRSRCRCASRTCSASSPPSGCSTRASLLNLFTWATLAFEATFFVLVWNRAPAPVGDRRRRRLPPRHRRLPRHRLLQPRHLPRLPGLRPRRRRRPDRRPVRPRARGRRRRCDAGPPPLAEASRRAAELATRRLAIEPAEEDGDGRGSWRTRWPAPFMMRSSASPWASTRTRASKTGTRSSSLPWTTSSGRGATFGAQAHRPQVAELAGPRVDVGGEGRLLDDARPRGRARAAASGATPSRRSRRARRGWRRRGPAGRRPPRRGPARRRCRSRPATRR